MAKKRVRIELEADLDEAVAKEAKKRGIPKHEVVRQCAQKFLHGVADTSPNQPKRNQGK